MPYFSERVDCEIDVTPGEFIDKCSNNELEELIDELEGTRIFMQRYYDKTDGDVGEVRSYGHMEFLTNLNALRKSWYQISKEDAEIIAILSKKYGVF